MLAVLSEGQGPQGAYVVSFHGEGMPAHSHHEYHTIEQALAAFRDLDWREPPEDTDNDVLKVADA
jgi:hypothetical protein